MRLLCITFTFLLLPILNAKLVDFVEEALRVQRLVDKSNRSHGEKRNRNYYSSHQNNQRRNHQREKSDFYEFEDEDEDENGNFWNNKRNHSRNSNNYSNNNYNSNSNNNNYNNNHQRGSTSHSTPPQNSIISRLKFFPSNSVKEVHCSPDGNNVAYIAKSNSTGLDSIHLVPVFGTSSFANVISDNVHIKSMRFAGNRYVVYTCVDENNHVRLKSANLKSKERKDISPVENAHFIRVIAMGESGIITLSHDGNDYITNRVNVSNGSSIQIKKDRLPFAAIFDENLAPQLWYKNITEQSVDVFINDGTKNGRQIDQINPKEEKYIGKFGSKCFKLRIRRNGNESEVDLLSLNLADNSQHTTVIKDIQEVSDCNVQFNASGDPLLINVNKGRITNSAIHASADRHINHLNRTLSEDWRIVDATTNGDKWLVCASDPQKSNEYWYYDTTNMRAKRVVVANEALSNERKLRPVDYVKIPSRDGSYIRGYLIKNLNHSIQSPLVIITNSKRFSWEFAPLAQFIANRGCAVLCLNCRPDYDGAGNDEESRREASDIIEATEWCFKNKIALVGHVSILGREKGALFAIDAFLKHQKYFAGCVLLSPTFSDEDNPLFHGNTLNRLEKPLCVIGHINDAGQFADSSFAEKMGHLISYLAYHQKPGNDLMAGLVEKCISVLHKNVYAEKMSAKSMSSFNSLVDGLGILTDKKVDEDTSIGESKSAYDML